jgi:catechol 2,3-dioxygenase-like lactoylglutathione lyase family enzyme
VSEDPFALVFEAHGVALRIANVSGIPDFKPAPFTILGWEVRNAEKTVEALSVKGVQFERFPGMNQNEMGIWDSPSGARVAWFRDPDGNILSVTEA